MNDRRHLVDGEDLLNVVKLFVCCRFVLFSTQKSREIPNYEPSSIEQRHDKGYAIAPTAECQDIVQYAKTDFDITVLLKIFSMNDSDKWFQNCMKFFSELFKADLKILMSFTEWMELVEDGIFDPEIPPVITTHIYSNHGC